MRFSVAFFIYSHYYDVVCLCSHSYKMMNSQLSCLSVDTRWYFCRLGFSLTVFFCVSPWWRANRDSQRSRFAAIQCTLVQIATQAFCQQETKPHRSSASKIRHARLSGKRMHLHYGMPVAVGNSSIIMWSITCAYESKSNKLCKTFSW